MEQTMIIMMALMVMNGLALAFVSYQLYLVVMAIGSIGKKFSQESSIAKKRDPQVHVMASQSGISKIDGSAEMPRPVKLTWQARQEARRRHLEEQIRNGMETPAGNQIGTQHGP